MRQLKRNCIFGGAFILTIFVVSCANVTKIAANTQKKGLTESQIIAGLKDALNVGSKNAATILNKKDGYFRDAAVKIPFPPELSTVERTLRSFGAGSNVDTFIERMNRGAEDAAIESVDIFAGKVRAMTFADARTILFGGVDNAATQYFKRTTTDSLAAAFRPKIGNSLDKVHATTLWREITQQYNKIPGVNKVDTDLIRYVCDRALSGLFSKIEIEERRIRKEPAFRVTAILKQVFGELDKK
ncbi:MAG: DUF4197 domain-containing protein [Spirochaetota bacterium]|nr:DUF4197 domain-containing protein [Spirochaetota bacterium]